MKAVSQVRGTAVPFDRADIDTDAIIPQQWLITTEREGMGIGLFANWRYQGCGLDPDPSFILNAPRFAGARILVAGPNYGCGSSREHAVWAHLDYGIEAVVAPSFGPIFHANALKNGLLVVVLDPAVISDILRMLAHLPANEMVVDLTSQTLCGPDGIVHQFDFDPERRRALLQGQDDIAATLAMQADIVAFQARDRFQNPWIWPDT